MKSSGGRKWPCLALFCLAATVYSPGLCFEVVDRSDSQYRFNVTASVYPPRATVGDEIRVDVTMTNTGSRKLEGINVRVQPMGDSAKLADVECEGPDWWRTFDLAPGESRVLTARYEAMETGFAKFSYMLGMKSGKDLGFADDTVAIRIVEAGVSGVEPAGPVRPSREKRLVAVMEFEEIGADAGLSGWATQMVRAGLIAQGDIKVVELDRLLTVLSEQAFQQTGCTDLSCAVKLGRVLNANYMVLGACGTFMGKRYVIVRLVDVETAEIVFTEACRANDMKSLKSCLSAMAGRSVESTE